MAKRKYNTPKFQIIDDGVLKDIFEVLKKIIKQLASVLTLSIATCTNIYWVCGRIS